MVLALPVRPLAKATKPIFLASGAGSVSISVIASSKDSAKRISPGDRRVSDSWSAVSGILLTIILSASV